MVSSVLKFIRHTLGNPITHLGSLEGDYRFSSLKEDINRSILHILLVDVFILLMIGADAVFYKTHPRLFTYMLLYRTGYVLISAAFLYQLRRTARVREFERIVFAWILITVLLLILLNFTRPASYGRNSIDAIVLLAIYMMSPLSASLTFVLAVFLSVATLCVDYFYKTEIPFVFVTAAYEQVVVNLLGLVSMLQLQSYRRKSYRASIEEKDAKETAAYLINTDHLTQSVTRRQFMNIAETEFKRFKRYQRALSILVIDADRFKQINDTYGHHAGDMTLRHLSLVAMEQKRAHDIFGRLGGEEFALMLPETTMEQALIVAERVRHAWELSPVTLDGELIHFTVSIGVVEAVPDDETLDDLLRRADHMLYKAKESGRNCVVSK